MGGVVRKVRAKLAHTVGALCFCSKKQLGVLLHVPPPPPPSLAWDASPSQGYPQQNVGITHLYTWVKSDNVESQCFDCYIGGLHCRHVGGQNKRTFAHIICIKNGRGEESYCSCPPTRPP